jgi:hypothetical protein
MSNLLSCTLSIISKCSTSLRWLSGACKYYKYFLISSVSNNIVRNLMLGVHVPFKLNIWPKKRLGYVNPNLINKIQLNPQINENSQKYKNMKVKSKIVAKNLTTENRTVVSTYLGQTMLQFQPKACIMAPYNFK